MTNGKRKLPSDGYAVGYRKPPDHTRFRRGVSGNPGGRPRRMTRGRAHKLILQEAFRLVMVREGDKIIRLPALQAVLRSQVALAAKGNGPAQRAVIGMINAIEQAMHAQSENPTQNITVSWMSPNGPEATPAPVPDQGGRPHSQRTGSIELEE